MEKKKENTKLSYNDKKKLYIVLCIWSVIMIASGLILNVNNKDIIKTKYNVKINQKHIAQQRSHEIKLKEIEIEIDTPLSVDVKDYLEDTDNLDETIYDYLRLDTSNVKTNEAGTYTYTVTYKKKKYNGTIIVKEKELPNIALQLKSVKLEIGNALPTDLQDYIATPLTKEMKSNITLDISKVNNTQTGEYQYTITYNKIIYVGTVTVSNPKVIIPTIDDEKNTQEPEKTP